MATPANDRSRLILTQTTDFVAQPGQLVLGTGAYPLFYRPLAIVAQLIRRPSPNLTWTRIVDPQALHTNRMFREGDWSDVLDPSWKQLVNYLLKTERQPDEVVLVNYPEFYADLSSSDHWRQQALVDQMVTQVVCDLLEGSYVTITTENPARYRLPGPVKQRINDQTLVGSRS